jgi:hypothetical protein
MAQLRSWRVIIIRSKGEYLGSVEAPEIFKANAAPLDRPGCGHWPNPRLC